MLWKETMHSAEIHTATRSFWTRWLVGLLLLMAGASGCLSEPSWSTGKYTCVNAQLCPPGQVCVNGVCLDLDTAQAPVDASADAESDAEVAEDAAADADDVKRDDTEEDAEQDVKEDTQKEDIEEDTQKEDVEEDTEEDTAKVDTEEDVKEDTEEDACTPHTCTDYESCETYETCEECTEKPDELCNGEDDDCDGETDQDGEQLDCPAGQVCKEGDCCEDECPQEGDRECTDGTHFRTCGNFDDDGCLEWKESECAEGSLCEDGECACDPQTCSELGYECGNWDDGCGSSLDCGECSGPNQECSEDGVCVCAHETCGDACCAEGEVCTGGECCEPHHSFQCHTGDVYWYDSCDNREEVKENCTSDQVCVTDECCTPATCDDLGDVCDSQDDGCGGTIDCVCKGGALCDGGICIPSHVTSGGFGGDAADIGRGIAVDSSGNVYLTGCFGCAGIDFGGDALSCSGTQGIFLAKFDADGNHVWSKGFGGDQSDCGEAIALDGSGKVYITGYFTSDTIDFGCTPLSNDGGQNIIVAQFDPAGECLWAKEFGLDDDEAGTAITVDAKEDVYITGYFKSKAMYLGGIKGVSNHDTGGGIADAFVAKFDPDDRVPCVDDDDCTPEPGGSCIGAEPNRFCEDRWSEAAGGDGDDVGRGIAVGANGRLYVTGDFQSTDLKFGPMATALENSGSPGTSDLFVVRLNPTEPADFHEWSKGFGGTGDDIGYGIAIDGDKIYVAGSFKSSSLSFGGSASNITNAGAGAPDIFLVSFDTAGSAQKAKGMGATGEDVARSVAVDSAGDIYLTGSTTSSIDFGGGKLSNAGKQDLYIVKFDDSNWDHVWSRSYGSSEADEGLSIAVGGGTAKPVAVTGVFGAAFDFGGGELSFEGITDLYLAIFGQGN